MCEKCRSTLANATWVSCENLPKDTSVASHTHTQTHSHTNCLTTHVLALNFSAVYLFTWHEFVIFCSTVFPASHCLPSPYPLDTCSPAYICRCLHSHTHRPPCGVFLFAQQFKISISRTEIKKNINENREFSLISFCYANRSGTPPKIGIKYSIPLFWLHNSFCPTALTHCLGFTFAQESQVHGLCALFPFHCVAVDSNLIPIKYNI